MALMALTQAMDEIRDKLAMTASDKRLLRSLCRSNKVDLNKDECEVVFEDLTNLFVKIYDQKIKELIDECKIPQKIEELEEITKDSIALNDELGTKFGYRFSTPRDELLPYLKFVQDAYATTLDAEIDLLTSDLNKMKDVYDEKCSILKAKVKALEDKLT